MRENSLPLIISCGVLGHLLPVECTCLVTVLYGHSDSLPVSSV